MSNYADVMARGFEDELKKLASQKLAGAEQAAKPLLSKILTSKPLWIGGGSIGLYETGRRAERDRRLGRQLRMQSGGRY